MQARREIGRQGGRQAGREAGREVVSQEGRNAVVLSVNHKTFDSINYFIFLDTTVSQ